MPLTSRRPSLPWTTKFEMGSKGKARERGREKPMENVIR